jgi:magnesium-transporting ATPase (P-type)
MQASVVFIGLVMAVATLATIDLFLPGGMLEADGTLDRARTAGFTVLVMAQLFNALNARSERESALRSPFRNRRLVGALALSLVLQVSVVHLPFLNAAFGTVPLSAGDWAVCVAIGSSVLWAEELRKWLARRDATLPP